MDNYGPLPGLGVPQTNNGVLPARGVQAPGRLEVRQTQETNPDKNALWRELARIIFKNIPSEQKEDQDD